MQHGKPHHIDNGGVDYEKAEGRTEDGAGNSKVLQDGKGNDTGNKGWQNGYRGLPLCGILWQGRTVVHRLLINLMLQLPFC